MAFEGKALVSGQGLDIGQVAGDEIVHADNFMAFVQEALAQMGADKTGPAGD